MAAYSASKAAVIGLTTSLGKELATSGVLVNVVVPAVIATPMNADTDPAVLAHITSLIPMRRVGAALRAGHGHLRAARAGEPEEVAELVAWLCSDKVSFSTGATWDVTGGRATY